MDASRVLARGVLNAHPDDAARVIEGLPPHEVASFLGASPPAAAAAVLQRTAPLAAARCLEKMSHEAAASVIGHLPLSIAANLLRRTEQAARESLLAALPKVTARKLATLLRSAENTAATLLDPHVMTLSEDLSVRAAREQLRRFSPAASLSLYAYVVRGDHTLVGVVSVRRVLLSRATDRVGAIMSSPVASIPALARRPAILRHPDWQRFHILPVTDDAGVLLGAIRYAIVQDPTGRQATSDAPDTTLALVVSIADGCWKGLAVLLKGLAATMQRP
jgi:magnesium transporter